MRVVNDLSEQKLFSPFYLLKFDVTALSFYSEDTIILEKRHLMLLLKVLSQIKGLSNQVA